MLTNNIRNRKQIHEYGNLKKNQQIQIELKPHVIQYLWSAIVFNGNGFNIYTYSIIYV